MNEWLINLFADMTLFSGLAVAIITGAVWVISRTFAHQGQIKNLDEKIDRNFKHLEEKIDLTSKNLENKIDLVIDSNNKLMKSHDDRISRLEKYFDIIMSGQIRKNSDQLKMEG